MLGLGGAAAIVLGPGSMAAIVLGLGGMAAIVLRLWETAAITDLPSPSWPAICTTTPLALAIDPQTSAAEAAASGRDWCIMPPPNPTACPGRPRSRLPLLVAPAVKRFNGGLAREDGRKRPFAPRSNWRRRDRDHEQAAEDRITVEALESHVWRLREGFSRNERASWYQSTLFGRRAAQQRAAIAAALHIADGALGLLERRAQGLSRGGENQREQHGERGDGPHGDRSSP